MTDYDHSHKHLTIVAYRHSVIIEDTPTMAETDRLAAIADARRRAWYSLPQIEGYVTLEFQFAAPWPHTRSIEFVRLNPLRARQMVALIDANPGSRERSGYVGVVAEVV